MTFLLLSLGCLALPILFYPFVPGRPSPSSRRGHDVYEEGSRAPHPMQRRYLKKNCFLIIVWHFKFLFISLGFSAPSILFYPKEKFFNHCFTFFFRSYTRLNSWMNLNEVWNVDWFHIKIFYYWCYHNGFVISLSE